MNANNPVALNDLAWFVAVAEAQGFSAAARRLSVSKAMLSVSIARLEARLHVQLFQRTTRRLSLTEAGAAMLPHAQRALHAARDAEEVATQALASPRGTLRVNAPMSFGLVHVMPVLSTLVQRYPELNVDLVLDDRVLDLVKGGFDLAVRIGALPDSGLVAQRVGTNRMVIVAHPKYLKRAGTPRQPADLAEHAVLVYSLSPTGARWTLTRGAKSEVVRVRGRIRANSSLALRHALLQGLGLARMPYFAVHEELERGRLVRLLPEWQLADQGVFALTTARDYVPRKTRIFIELLREHLAPAYR